MLVGFLFACSPEAPVPVDHVSADEIEQATRAMTDLGPRLVTTAAETEALAVLQELLVEAGVPEVAPAPFVWDAWLPGEAQILLGERAFAAEPLSPSPSVTGLTAPILTGDVLEGGAAVLFSGDGSRAEHFVQASMGGAEALIRVTEEVDDDGTMLVEVGHLLAGASIPAVAVDAETGEALAAAEGEPVTLTIEASVIGGHVSNNLVARVPGRDSRPIFVTAHYDSWHTSESAFDNALGVGALVVLARQLAQGPTPAHDVIFLLTTGEEQGLQGGFAWVGANEGLAGSAMLVMNLDVLWAAEGQFWVQASDEALRLRALTIAEEEGIDARDGGVPGVASDHFPFAIQGAPTMWNTRWPDKHYHTVADTLDQLDMDEAEAVVRMHWRLLAEVAGVPEQVAGD